LEEKKKQGEKLRTMMGPEEQTEIERKYSEVLSAIADEHGVDSVTTIAIAYVMQKAPYVFPIIGTCPSLVDLALAEFAALSLLGGRKVEVRCKRCLVP
jgi:predicted oxidoreductase